MIRRWVPYLAAWVLALYALWGCLFVLPLGEGRIVAAILLALLFALLSVFAPDRRDQ